MPAPRVWSPDRKTIGIIIMPIDSTHREQISRIQELTRLMDEASGLNDWDAVTSAEQERRPLISSCFADLSQMADGPESAAELQKLILEIISTDRQVSARAEQVRTLVGNELQSISRGHTVSQAYIQNQG